MNLSRRGFLAGLGAALAAPAIVKIEHIMPVRNRLIVPTMYVGEIRGMVFHWDGNPRTIKTSDFEGFERMGWDAEVLTRAPRVIRAPGLGPNKGLMLPRRA